MHDVPGLVLACLSGIVIGGVFFGGLWWTVRHGLSSQHPALWLLGSGLLRTGFAVTGFYLIGRNDWKRLLATLVGFIIARTIVLWKTREPGERAHASEQGHAP